MNLEMENREMIEVLGRFKVMIKVLKLCNLNVSNVRSLDIFYKFLITIPMLAFLLTLFMVTWFLLDHGFILDEILYAIPVFLGISQIFPVSVSLISKKEIIYEAVNHLQVLIGKRNISSVKDFLFTYHIFH